MKQLWNDYMINTVVIYSTENCGYCKMAKQLAESKKCNVEYKMMGTDYTAQEFMKEFPTARTFPQVIYNGQKIGGYSNLVEVLEDGV